MKEQLLSQTPGKTNEIYFLEESLDKQNIYFRSLPVDQIDVFCETTELKFDRFTENGVPVLVKHELIDGELSIQVEMLDQTGDDGYDEFRNELFNALNDFVEYAKSHNMMCRIKQ